MSKVTNGHTHISNGHRDICKFVLIRITISRWRIANFEARVDESLKVTRRFVGGVIDRVGRQVERTAERKAKVDRRDADTTDERHEVTAGTKYWDVWRLTVNATRIAMQPRVIDCSTSVTHLLVVWVVHLSNRHHCVVCMYT